MPYKLTPRHDSVVVVQLEPEEIQELLDRKLISLETDSVNVLQYGRVVSIPLGTEYPSLIPGSIVLYAGLGADKTNFGDPRQLIVPYEDIKASLNEETGDAHP